jgi:hypothetical protein
VKVGFRSPQWLWLLGLIPPLVLLYVLKVRRERSTVSSTRFWRTALLELDAQVPFRRLRRDWLLLAQILAVALLAFAAAGPYRRTLVTPGVRSGIVVDASAGMLADGRMREALRAAAGIIDGLGPRDEVLVIRAGARPTVVIPLTEDRRAAGDALAEIAASPVHADLDDAVRLARSIVGPEGTVIVLTDGTQPLPETELTVVTVGKAVPNAGLVAMGARPSDPSGSDHEVFVRIRNSWNEAARGTVSVLVDGRVRDAAELAIEPEGEATRTLGVVGAREGVVEVVWEPATGDALKEDNRAAWVLRPPERRRFAVGESDVYLRHALEILPGWTRAGAGEPADLEVVVGRSPAPEGGPFLWINPRELEESVAEGAAVLDWDRAHPVLRFANLGPVRLGRVPRVERPSGARVLAESTAGPLILEGVRGQRRYILWAFDPSESDLPLRASFPLLVHNTAEYLVPPRRGLSGSVATGSSPEIPWSGDDLVVLVGPSGEDADLPVAAGVLRIPVLEETGLWRVVGRDREVTLAVALLDEREVDLRGSAAVDIAGTGTAGPARRADARSVLQEIWRPLALLALVLLMLEGAGFHRRWPR